MKGLTEEQTKQLKELAKEFKKKVNRARIKLDVKLTTALVVEMKKIVGDSKYDGAYGDIESTAEMFVNNQITMYSIWDDPSGDWDDEPRVKTLTEEVD